MSLAELVRGVVQVADAVTASLQVPVLHAAYMSQDAYGKPTRAAAVSRQAIVVYRQKPVRTNEGHEQISPAQILFPRGSVTVDVRDEFTLPDGRTAPVLEIGSVADPSGGGYYQEVALGWMRR
jgi:hypothetical protein